MSETKDDVKTADDKLSKWTGLVKATGSPLKLFALMVLVCNTAFGITSAVAFGPDIFVYTLHTFLAVVASFVLIALWSPRSFYTPMELLTLVELEEQKADRKPVFPESKPLVATVLLALGVLAYLLYQLSKG
jgi:hypothetical protein